MVHSDLELTIQDNNNLEFYSIVSVLCYKMSLYEAKHVITKIWYQ
jgi:hypothetical protein